MHRPHLTAAIGIREPTGARSVALPARIGGSGADIVVPGIAGGAQLLLSHVDAQWRVAPVDAAQALLDGQPLRHEQELRNGDVIGFGDAQLRFCETQDDVLLEVAHLAGNATIAPLDVAPVNIVETSDEEVQIRAAGLPVARVGATGSVQASVAVAATPRRRFAWAVAALVLLALSVVWFRLESVPLDLYPADATVDAPGSLHWHSGNRLFALPGTRTLRATRDGYFPLQVQAPIGARAQDGSAAPPLRLHLARRPGILKIDTGGTPASVWVDGAERGTAPGDVEVPAGHRLVMLRAPRHLDFVRELDIEGAGARQELTAVLQPAWGRLEVVADPAGARVLVDGKEAGVAPVSLELDAGVHQIRIEAPQRKPWDSRVALRAGETLALGPLTLGQADAVVAIRSQPAGAAVNITGAYRGRTPVQVELPAGAAHDVVVSLAGYRDWSRNLRPVAGARSSLDARLEPVLVEVEVRGEPDGADLLVDGESRGRTPQRLQLSATTHRLLVRKQGYADWEAIVTPSEGMPRQVQYALLTPGEAKRGAPLAAQLVSKRGLTLRLVPPGTFQMGSERREQGRRPNEGFRQVSLVRPFYLGEREVSNAQYRAFRTEHVSGFVDKQTLDLDAYPVTGVSWDEAAEFCNWLSQQEGLPAAYERKDGHYALIQPVTTGYRLPTEAEWEYAARYVDGRTWRRFSWGDALPVPQGAENLSGQETQRESKDPKQGEVNLVESALPDYRDEHGLLAPAGSYRANALGLFDMAGNVSEWVNDSYQSFVDASPAVDPLGPGAASAAHVVRGASWKTAAVAELRLAARAQATGGANSIGFRVARYAEPPP